MGIPVVTLITEPGIYNLSAAEYHSGPGVSKSNLDLIHECPALLEWSRNAPTDDDARSAVNIGTAFHALILEPDVFNKEYVVDFAPPSDAISTVEELKAALMARGIEFKASANKSALTKALLDSDPDAPVTDALHDEWRKGVNGRIVLSAAEWKKLDLMRGSLLAHPVARWFVEADGKSEQNFYAYDDATGELIRARMDRTLANRPIIVDLKTTGDIGRFEYSVQDYRYYVQDPFYSDIYQKVNSQKPTFVFIVVSTTRDRCRYPVRVMKLPPEQAQLGRDEYREDLNKYAECKASGIWAGIENISLPERFLKERMI
ncbi:hypothetical protein AD948_05755 [Acetobacter senegalensis]|uniref:Putative exodeoxyribonuclease 8 PDDEXK-like domain-containing protein n=1 Tax=Acetobacter senegalensis TaxID=446692 RepID=A0A149U469_9PROT|nr:hypothetical protein AD948_05755 [Acetobacter senegalensis]